jgi:hypothetical protein
MDPSEVSYSPTVSFTQINQEAQAIAMNYTITKIHIVPVPVLRIRIQIKIRIRIRIRMQTSRALQIKKLSDKNTSFHCYKNFFFVVPVLYT